MRSARTRIRRARKKTLFPRVTDFACVRRSASLARGLIERQLRRLAEEQMQKVVRAGQEFGVCRSRVQRFRPLGHAASNHVGGKVIKLTLSLPRSES